MGTGSALRMESVIACPEHVEIIRESKYKHESKRSQRTIPNGGERGSDNENGATYCKKLSTCVQDMAKDGPGQPH